MHQRILVPTDGSACASEGLAEAIALAKLSGGQLRIVHVIDETYVAFALDGGGAGAGAGGDLVTALRDAGKQVLAKAVAQVEAAGLPVEQCLLDSFEGLMCDLVIAEARSWKADLIVIGTHGRRGASRLLLGSGAEQILRLSPVPVLLVRAR